MTKSIITFMLSSFHLLLCAQKKDTISYYISSTGERVEQKAATFLRVGVPDDTLMQVFDFYLINNKVQMKTWAIDDSLKIFHGPASYFYKSGAPEGKGYFNNGKKTGLWKWYYENGNLKDSLVYKNGMPIGASMIYYENGTVSTKRIFDKEGNGNGTVVHYYQSGYTRDSGSHTANQRTGIWFFYREDQSKASEILFAADSAIKATYFDAKGERRTDVIFEKEATYPGGDEIWNKFLIAKLKDVYKKKNYEAYIGTCNIQFIVEKDGSISNVEAIESTNQMLEDYIILTIVKSKKWEPAIQYNLPVRAYRRQRFTIKQLE